MSSAATTRIDLVIDVKENIAGLQKTVDSLKAAKTESGTFFEQLSKSNTASAQPQQWSESLNAAAMQYRKAAQHANGFNTNRVGAFQRNETAQSPTARVAELGQKFGNVSANIGSAITDNIGTAVNKISQQFTRLIIGAQSWGDTLRNIGASIVTGLIQSLLRMALQWVTSQIIMATAGKAIAAAMVAGNAPLAATAAGLWAGPAALATIATSGGAALAAPAQVAASVLSTQASSVLALAEGGAVRGPGNGTSDSIPAMLSHGEFVMPAARVKQYGEGLFEGYRQGRVPRNSMSMYHVPVRASSATAFASGGLVGGLTAATNRADRTAPSSRPTSLRYSDENTRIESVLKQKKEFQFRTKNSEIGGDLCSIQEITLMGKTYLVILNADAMGKSIQGAGGALVMGTVFKAIITRTQLSRSNQKKTPEKWLKDCYTELQNVFVTFDGSMLVSAVIALFDQETGALYSINAEHPWMVLYRDGKANFLDHELLLRKIGFTENASEPIIRVFKLEPNDFVFIGSDGRDDILLKRPGSDETFMNEDETLFLRLVELANGDLADLEKLLHHAGEVTDDLSIMKIAYKTEAELPLQKIPSAGDEYNRLVKEGIQEIRKKNLKVTRELFEKALSISDADPGLYKQLARICINQKDFSAAAGYSESYVGKFPFDNEFLYYTSFTLRKIKEYSKAIEYSERLRSREPENIRNLKHLVELYRLVGNRSKFRSIMTNLKALVAEKEARDEDLDQDVSSETILV